MKLSICITTWNTPILIRECIDSIRDNLTLTDYEILILDLGNDKKLKSIKNLRVWHHLPPSSFAKSNNFLAKQAKANNILFLNSDATLTKGCAELMLKELTGKVGVVGCRVVYPMASKSAGLVQHAGIFIKGLPPQPGSGFTTRGFQKPDNHTFGNIEDVPAVTASCVLVNGQAFSQIGGFDEAFVNGYEDVELCISMWASGWRVRYCGQALAKHLGNGTKGTTGNAATALEYLEKNTQTLVKKLKSQRSTIKKLQRFRP